MSDIGVAFQQKISARKMDILGILKF